MEKKTLSTALGFEPRSFDCRSTALTTELHRRPTSSSLFILKCSGLSFIFEIQESFIKSGKMKKTALPFNQSMPKAKSIDR